MTANDQDQFLFKCLDKAISKYRSESKKLKRWTFAIRIAVLFLAASSTVLLGWNANNNPDYLIWSRNTALALGALCTFIVGLSSFWNVETYWLKQKVLFARVRALKERCDFLKSKGELTPEAIDAVFSEYREMMDDRIEYWEKVASRKTPNKANAADAKNRAAD
jgi:hypothetical protein